MKRCTDIDCKSFSFIHIDSTGLMTRDITSGLNDGTGIDGSDRYTRQEGREKKVVSRANHNLAFIDQRV